jgi:hypothetical protein
VRTRLPVTLYRRDSAHPEAADWAARVVANGGTVGTSLPAVDAFCRAIDAAGIRSRMYRLNLFCGGTSGTAVGLNSALVPLFRGPSLGGTQHGGATDTNVGGLFVSGDYNETGASGGLKGNGTTKHLDTGFQQSTVSLSNLHLSASFLQMDTSGTAERTLIGHYNAAQADFAVLRSAITSGNMEFFAGSFSGASSTSYLSSASHLMGVRSSQTSAVMYSAGVSVGTSATNVGSPSTSALSYFVFARNNGGTADTRTSVRIRMYSIGQAIDAAGASAFANAVAAFNTAMGRT